jgi:hypothetical protein
VRGLRILLLVHAVITFAAGVTLFAAPAAIPGVVGVMVTSDTYLAFIVFHATTGAGELYAFVRGIDATVLGNVALRLLMVVLFARYGLRGRRFEGAADGRHGT